MEVAAFHPARKKAARRLVSVALFLALGVVGLRFRRLLRTAVSRHPALWSPDFPPDDNAAGDCLTDFATDG